MVAMAGIVIALTAAGYGDAPARPNILILFADDLGAKELACYGHPAHKTPNVDRLASEGTLFKTCWATPVCTPSRVMLMTGRYAVRTGWFGMYASAYSPKVGTPEGDLGSRERTFADLAKAQGYATALAGKWQLPGEGESLVHDCGFDHYLIWAYKYNLPPGVVHTGAWESGAKQKTSRYWHPCLMRDGEYVRTSKDDYGPDLMADFVIEFMKSHKDKPWLIYHPMCPTHPPLEPTPDPNNPGQRLPGGLATNVAYLDHLVGRITATVDELELSDRTYIFFMADNGTARDGKGTVTELGVRVPLIVKGPAVEVGKRSDALVSIADIFPTVAELIQAPIPSDRPIDGVSLLTTLAGKEARHREWIFSYLQDKRMIRDSRWLLEGDGRLYDTGGGRTPGSYRVADEANEEVQQARTRFESILAGLPAHPKVQRDADGNEAKRRKRASRPAAVP